MKSIFSLAASAYDKKHTMYFNASNRLRAGMESR